MNDWGIDHVSFRLVYMYMLVSLKGNRRRLGMFGHYISLCVAVKFRLGMIFPNFHSGFIIFCFLFLLIAKNGYVMMFLCWILLSFLACDYVVIMVTRKCIILPVSLCIPTRQSSFLNVTMAQLTKRVLKNFLLSPSKYINVSFLNLYLIVIIFYCILVL